MNMKKSDNRLERLMFELGLTKFLTGVVEILDGLGDEDAKLRKLKHGLRILSKEYSKTGLDDDDEG